MSQGTRITIPQDLAEFVEVFQRMEQVDLDLSTFAELALREYLERRGYRMPSEPFWLAPAPHGGGDPTAGAEHDRILAEAHE